MRPRAASPAEEDDDRLEEQYDLLTAALLGVAIGVGATLLLRTGPRGERPLSPLMRVAGRGAKWAGIHSVQGARLAGKGSARGAEWVRDRAEDFWDSEMVEDAREAVSDYVEAARDTINDTVESELRDLRKTIRKRRKKLGI